jgi:hypothetical protein
VGAVPALGLHRNCAGISSFSQEKYKNMEKNSHVPNRAEIMQ